MDTNPPGDDHHHMIMMIMMVMMMITATHDALDLQSVQGVEDKGGNQTTFK